MSKSSNSRRFPGAGTFQDRGFGAEIEIGSIVLNRSDGHSEVRAAQRAKGDPVMFTDCLIQECIEKVDDQEVALATQWLDWNGPTRDLIRAIFSQWSSPNQDAMRDFLTEEFGPDPTPDPTPEPSTRPD